MQVYTLFEGIVIENLQFQSNQLSKERKHNLTMRDFIYSLSCSPNVETTIVVL